MTDFYSEMKMDSFDSSLSPSPSGVGGGGGGGGA